MKQNLLLITLIALAFNAQASDRDNGSNSQSTSNASAYSSSYAGANALSGSVSGAVGLGGTSSAYTGPSSAQTGASSSNNAVSLTNSYDAERIPVSTAVAPSITQNIICPIITPNSHAVQFLIFGGSTTGKQSINAICVAYQLGQTDVVERMACNADAAYRKANPNCEVQ